MRLDKLALRRTMLQWDCNTEPSFRYNISLCFSSYHDLVLRNTVEAGTGEYVKRDELDFATTQRRIEELICKPVRRLILQYL